MMNRFSIIFMASLLSSAALAQDAEDETKFAHLTATTSIDMPKSGLISIDLVCRDDDALFVETRLRRALIAQGYKIETQAPYVLRLELHPCEDVGLLPGRGGVAEAYQGSSKPEEFRRAAPLWRIPLGKGSTAEYNVSARLLLFRTGGNPIWSAHIKGIAGTLGLRPYKTRLVDEALKVFGETADKTIRIE